MTEEEIISTPLAEPKTYKGKLYKVRSIYGAVFIGGPPAAAYIISHNFRVLGEKKKAVWTWIALVAFIALIIIMPEGPSSLNFIFAIASFVISVNVMNRFQEKQITEYIEAGHVPYSSWRGVSIGFISLAIIGLLAFGFFYMASYLESSPDSEVYKKDGNTIYYYPEQMDKPQVVKLVDELYKYRFITKEGSAGFTIIKENEEYQYYFPFTESVWTNREYVDYYKSLKDSIQKDLPLQRIRIVICDSAYTLKLKI